MFYLRLSSGVNEFFNYECLLILSKVPAHLLIFDIIQKGRKAHTIVF